ncbi:unnamed protein product, partial [Enterobius vermicularis]|uniref:LRRCT domain-containing protein n=1 Tax=Enterobius vermicularis TaxID=51028 RepID=A0A0N4VBH2_ENTVE
MIQKLIQVIATNRFLLPPLNNPKPEIRRLPKAEIRSIRLNNCGIKTVAPDAFTNFSDHLEELNLSGNEITTIPQLDNLARLITLDFSYNKITEIPENCFSNVKLLKNLKLQGNSICTLPRLALNEIKEKLELLDLSNNCLNHVPAQNLRNSLNMQYLDLSRNSISEIANFELINLPQLQELRMQRNNLQRIAPMAFMNVPKLQHLYLNENLLSNFESIRMFQNLEILDLSRNQLKELPLLKELPMIKEIRADFNQIGKIDTLTFSSNPSLKLINLQNNQISSLSRNGFDSLEQLNVLLLNNNLLASIERGMLDGMRNLQQLSLSNNSLINVSDKSFSSVPLLTSLDLSNNKIESLSANLFDPLTQLFWLDLSNNKIVSIEKGTFKNRIAHVLLHGNHLVCDKNTEWLVDYLVANHVRTFLPFQSEIVCTEPEKNVGVRLKDLMIRKSNETMNVQRQLNHPPTINQNLLQKIISDKFNTGYQNSLPTPPQNSQRTQVAISDVVNAIRTMPNAAVNIPGLGNINLSQLPPSVISYVLRGGQIPGVPKETLDKVIASYAERIQSAYKAQNGNTIGKTIILQENNSSSSSSYTNAVINLDDLQKLSGESNESSSKSSDASITTDLTDSKTLINTIRLPPQLLQLLKLLPPNYDITKIPNEVMQTVSKNEIPDFALLPADLQQHLMNNIHNVVNALADKQNVTIDDILKKLPKFDRPAAPTFAPYSIDEVRNDLIHTKNKLEKQRRIHLYTELLLSFVGAISTIVIIVLCIYTKRKRQAQLVKGVEADSL